jgi:hypothetical protein
MLRQSIPGSGRLIVQPPQLLRREIEAEQPIDGAVQPVQDVCRHGSITYLTSSVAETGGGGEFNREPASCGA